MGPSESELLQLIGAIYDAMENPAAWVTFLELYARALDARATYFQAHRLAERSSQMSLGFGVGNRLTSSYNQHYARLNIWRDRGRHQFEPGRAFADQQMCARSELLRTEFYNDYLVPLGLEYSAGGVIKRDGDDVYTLGALRERRQGPFGEAECKLVEALLPHLARARAIGNRLQLLNAEQSLLDTLDVGVVFLTSRAEVLHCNRTAEEMLESGDGLGVHHGTLTTGTSSDARLRETIRHALSAGTASLTCPAAVPVPRPSLKRPYQLMIAPLRSGLAFFWSMIRPEVVMLIVDPDSHHPSPPALLHRLYGLTAREAALASALSTGTTLEQAAEELGMTYETARSHLRRILGKTNTSRQGELILLLARLPKQAVNPKARTE